MHILTYTGRKFYPANPQAGDVRIQDIAHALSNLCRFTGHVRTFYSVAEHCVRASHCVPEMHALAVLLHDASEAYCADLSTPIKHSEPLLGYRQLEKKILIAIGKHFKVDWDAHSEQIHFADQVMLASEARDLLPGAVIPKEHSQLGYRIIPWTPHQAKQEYLRRYFELRPIG